MVSSKYNIIFINESKKYVYNMLSKALVEIDDSIEEQLKGEEIKVDEKTQEVLYDNGLVTIDNEFEAERMINNMNNLRYDSSRMGIFLSLTPDCNLNCLYCYQDARKELKETQFLEYENWRKIYNYIHRQIKKNGVNSLTIFLFGGEPMLKKQLEQYIQEMRKLPTRVMIVLITNGTMFNEDNVRFFCENIDSIQITIDGNKHIHNQLKPYKNGNGSFDDILKNLKLLIENNVKELSLRVNLNKETISSIYEFVDFLCYEGLNKSISAIKFANIFLSQNEMTDLMRKDEEVLEELGDLYLYAAQKGLKTFKDFEGGMCIGKMQYGFTIDEKLNVYACPGVVYQNPMAKLEEEIEINKKEWYQFIQDDPQCVKTCNYAPICFGGCRWSKRCNKKALDLVLKKILQAYVISFYSVGE